MKVLIPVLVPLLTILMLMMPTDVFAVDGSSGTARFNFQAKAKSKQTSRWTLEEWLAQKERNHMMDLWLAMYAPSPYEFYFGGAYQDVGVKTNDVEAPDRKQSTRGEIGAFAAIVGVTGEYQNSGGEKISDTTGAVNLRIAGNAVQGTHLILFYGNRNRSMERQGVSYYLRNQYIGGDLNLYLNHHFGLLGRYTQFQPSQEGDLGEVSGSQHEYGIFVDFGAMRLSGSFFSDTQKEVASGVENKIERTGSMFGLKFFF